MAVFIPREYQHLLRAFIFNNERCNAFAGMGTGKTSTSIESFAELKLFGEVERALVLAPKRVALHSWPDEMVKWKESFGHLSMAAAIGTADQRLAALRSTPDILTINYDNIEWLIDQYGDNWPFDMVFADESTRLKGLRISFQRAKRKDGTYGMQFIRGQGATRAKKLARVAHKFVRRWVNLTGSPAPNGLIDVWGQQWFVDGGQRLGNSFDEFSKRWFRLALNSTREQQILEPLPYAQEQIQRKLAETSMTINARDWFDIKNPIENIVYIDLPPRARKQYKEIQKEFFTWVQEHPVEVFNAGAKSMKCQQMASGSVYYDRDGNWAEVHEEKLKALESIVEETNGESLLIRYEFKPDKARILKAFPNFKTLDDKGSLRDFQEGRLRGLVVHAASAGHGLDLQQNCRTLVDYTSSHNLDHDEQIIERVGPTRQKQIGSDKEVYRYRIVARDTIEETVVLPVLHQKASLQNALRDAMRHTG